MAPEVTAIKDDSTVKAALPAAPPDPITKTNISAARHLSHYSWAKLIARVYETNPLQCWHCAGHMKIIASVVQASEIKKILADVDVRYPDAADQD